LLAESEGPKEKKTKSKAKGTFLIGETEIEAKPKATSEAKGKPCSQLPARLGLVDEFVGRAIPPLGGTQAKAAVMALLTGESRPRFSRLSGVQAMTNAVALFVNVVACAAYENLFLNGGREITWFGQRTHTENSAVIQRLIHHAEESVATALVLFCRLPRKSPSYVYCGQLGYVLHDSTVRPIRFVFGLLDHEELAASHLFGELVAENSRLADERAVSASALASGQHDLPPTNEKPARNKGKGKRKKRSQR